MIRPPPRSPPLSLHDPLPTPSGSRVHSEYSVCTAVTGCTACARRIVSGAASEMPAWRILPASTSSLSAPQVSSRSEEHTSELQSPCNLVCRLLLEKKKKSAPAFPKDDGRALANIWSLESGDDRKDLWCGVEPASLFRSGDGGDSWEMVPGISNHEHARKWQPGNGGLCLHTILRDGERVHLGISTGGHYLSEDGGRTFAASNKGIGVGLAPDPFPEWGQCVHKIARHKDAPGRLHLQNHRGLPRRPGIGVGGNDDPGRTPRS